MIPLFRKIRQKLLAQNQVTRYLAYAVGEIVLVVVGILIALQINTWNQNLQNLKQEQQLLAQLNIEYSSNLEQLNDKIFIRNGMLQSCLALLSYRKIDPYLVNVDSLNFHLSRMITRPTFNPMLGVTNEISSSGKLYLIKNGELRKELASFEGYLGDLTEEEMVIFNLTENLIQPFLVENYQMGKVNIAFLQDEDFMNIYSLGDVNKKIPLSELFESADYKPLLGHPNLEDYIGIVLTNTIYTNQQSEGVKEKIELILSLIKSETK
jgi:hypothetical protein